MRAITINPIRRIIKEYYDELYVNEFDKLDKTYKFLEKRNLPKPIQEEIEYLYNPITAK